VNSALYPGAVTALTRGFLWTSVRAANVIVWF
jgi:hypothetical protein